MRGCYIPYRVSDNYNLTTVVQTKSWAVPPSSPQHDASRSGQHNSRPEPHTDSYSGEPDECPLLAVWQHCRRWPSCCPVDFHLEEEIPSAEGWDPPTSWRQYLRRPASSWPPAHRPRLARVRNLAANPEGRPRRRSVSAALDSPGRMLADCRQVQRACRRAGSADVDRGERELSASLLAL